MTARLASQLEQGSLLFFTGRDEARLIRILGEGIITVNQGLGKLALDQAGQNVRALLGEDGL